MAFVSFKRSAAVDKLQSKSGVDNQGESALGMIVCGGQARILIVCLVGRECYSDLPRDLCRTTRLALGTSRMTLTLLGESSTLLSEPTALALSCLGARQRRTFSIHDPSRALCVTAGCIVCAIRITQPPPPAHTSRASARAAPAPPTVVMQRSHRGRGGEGKIGQRLGCGQWGGVTWGCLTCSGHGGRRGSVRRDVSGQVLDASRGRGMTRGRGRGWSVRRDVSGQVLDASRGRGMTRGKGREWSVRRDVSGQVLDASRGRGMTRGRGREGGAGGDDDEDQGGGYDGDAGEYESRLY